MLHEGEGAKLCFAVGRLRKEEAFLDPIEVAVYVTPTDDVLGGKEAPAEIAFLPRFTRVPRFDGQPAAITWNLGSGDYEGWIVATFKTITSASYTAGAPWSTCALWRLGHHILERAPQKPVCQAQAPKVGPAQAAKAPAG
jgi:hypothetical protein